MIDGTSAVEANKSFYQYIQLLGGVAFGVGELHFLRTGNLLDARVIFSVLISVGFLIGLLIKKKRLESIRERWSRLSEQNLRVDKWSVCRG